MLFHVCMDNVLTNTFNKIDALKRSNVSNRYFGLRIELITINGERFIGDAYSFELLSHDTCRYYDLKGDKRTFNVAEIVDFQCYQDDYTQEDFNAIL